MLLQSIDDAKNLYDDRQKQIEIAESINARADDVEAFVMQIVKASKEDFLNLQVENGEYYLSEIIESLSAFYEDKLSYLKIDMELSDYTNCLLKGDKERSVEVLQNMIENAVKYGNGSTIKINFSDEEDCQLISIENGGCTLSENAPHIFDSFWRGSNSENIGGSGLGLYICRQLMNKMDGEIFADMKGETMTMTAVFRKA